MERAFDILPNLEPLRMFEVLEKNENFGGKHEETFYYIVLSRLVFKLYFEFIVNLILIRGSSHKTIILRINF
ncbi:conserved hypothetical protein [Leptospira interrogans serovar Manilae]|uniref:Uncharacterized protein n=1 Tax=Leptospira interrogans serovar Manilae TaxID=214675 RepID=A0AAQ1SM90_LEPIR|nr:conserved hypothetical protein [Leptospira interrogans serovar Manilae]